MSTIRKPKACSCCRRTYPGTVEYFYSDKSRRDGLSPYCRTCARAKSRARYRANPAAYLANNKRWRQRNPEMSRLVIKRSKLRRVLRRIAA